MLTNANYFVFHKLNGIHTHITENVFVFSGVVYILKCHR